MIDWNDLRYLLAVADRGSTLAAGRALRVSQTTVARRIVALEQSLGLTLFDKRQAGYQLTPVGAALIGQAQSVAEAARCFEEAAAATTRQTSGTIRFTTEDIFLHGLLSPLLVEFHELHPEIRIDLDSSRTIRDLGAGEAEIALRSTSLPAPAGVVGRRLCDDDWTFYCSRAYADRHGVPTTKKALGQHALIGGGGGGLWRAYQALLDEFGLTQQVAIHQDNSSGLLTGVRSGLGVGVLPCIIAEGDEDLLRCMPPKVGHGRVLWILTHERVRRDPPVRLAVDFLYERLHARVKALGLG